MKRPGFYVEGKFFADRYHQARAHAAHLATLYGRGIEIVSRRIDDSRATDGVVIATVYNGKARKAA